MLLMFGATYILFSGKSQLVFDMLKANKQIFNPGITELIWCHGVDQPEFFAKIKKIFPKVQFHAGFPAEQIDQGKLFKSREGHNLLVSVTPDVHTHPHHGNSVPM